MKRIIIYTVMFIATLIAIAFVSYLINNKDKDEPIGKYVYLNLKAWGNGGYYVLHVSKDCEDNKSAQYMPINELADEYHNSIQFQFCTNCVSEKHYEQLMKIINQQK